MPYFGAEVGSDDVWVRVSVEAFATVEMAKAVREVKNNILERSRKLWLS